MSILVKNTKGVYYRNDQVKRTSNGESYLDGFTYLHTKDILKGIVTDSDLDVFPYLAECRVEIPVSILLCFLKTNNESILLPEIFHGELYYCEITDQRLENKYQKPNPHIGELVLMPLKYAHIPDSHDFNFIKIHDNEDYASRPLQSVENIQFARFFSDLEQSKTTLVTTRERYYFLQKLLFTVEMEETEKHVKDFKAFYNQHMKSKTEGVTIEQWSREFFSVRQDHLLQTYKSGSKFTDDIMSDIHSFIKQMQVSYNTIWGIMLGWYRMNVLNDLFFSDWFKNQSNHEQTFLYQKANLRLFFHYDDNCFDDNDHFINNCKVISKATMQEQL